MNNADFWIKEYKKHGTCTNMKLSPSDYFAKAIHVWKENPIEQWFNNSGILKNTMKHLTELEVAIISNFGYKPWFKCYLSGTKLREIALCYDELVKKS